MKNSTNPLDILVLIDTNKKIINDMNNEAVKIEIFKNKEKTYYKMNVAAQFEDRTMTGIVMSDKPLKHVFKQARSMSRLFLKIMRDQAFMKQCEDLANYYNENKKD